MDRVLLKADEAAEVLSLGRSKVYQMIAAGELPSIRIGRAVRVPTVALHNWVQARIEERTADAEATDQNSLGYGAAVSRS